MAEALEPRHLLAVDFFAVRPTIADEMADLQQLESDDLREAGQFIVQLDVDRALFRDRFGNHQELIWEPLDGHSHAHDPWDDEESHDDEELHDEDGELVIEAGDNFGELSDDGTLLLGEATEFTPSGIPLLDSFPTAPAAVYLDFDGNFEPQWGSARDVITPPYDLDGDPTSFNAEEQTRIEEIWLRVSEDFAPFNVNVTTDDTSDAVTTVNQINTAVDRIRTFYFRTEFNIANVSQVSDMVFNILRDDGVAVYLNGTEVVRNNLAANAGYRDFATAGVNDADETVYNPFPIASNLLVNGTNVLAVEVHQQSDTSSDVGFDMSVVATVGGLPNQPLVPAGSTWSYTDEGADQGVAWRASAFNDSGWKSGVGKFGYGDGDVVTALAVFQAAPRVRTTYFRHDFQVANLGQVANLTLNLLRDDGAAVYLNGVEIVRDNLPAGAAFDAFATSTVNGAAESTFFPFNIPVTRLVSGRNVLAVEVHQQSDTSSDLSFDLRLTGTINSVPAVALVPAGSDWKYLDDGSNQGTAWKESSFDDTAWRTGTAQFGYGDVEVGTVRVAIGSEDWFDGGAGGVAFVGAFDLNGTTTVFAFTNGVGTGAKNLAEVSSHEAGHAFGLGHQSTFDPLTGEKLEEYNPGSGNWGPIMGVSYGPELSTWHNGPTGSISNLQDDMSRIARTSNGFGYRTDDHGNGIATATPLAPQGGSFQHVGIIAQNSDVDAFAFTIGGPNQGGIRVELQNAAVGPNLDAVLEIRNSSGAIVTSANPANSLDASLDVSLAPGNYTLMVRTNEAYGRVGQYTISGDLDESLIGVDTIVHSGPLGSLAAVSSPYPARVHFANDIDQFSVFGQAGQLLTASITPISSASRLTVEIPGLVAPLMAASPGAAVQIPLTRLTSAGNYLLQVQGDLPGDYQVQFGWNTALESPGSGDGLPVAIDGSDAGLLGPRMAITGTSGDASDVVRTLIPQGATWRYMDNGSNQGTAWRQPTFNDSAWSSGAAEFGYGDGDEATLLDETSTSGTRVRTFYFRKDFDISDASAINSLRLLLKSDDGAAVYLNGVEVRRENLVANAPFDALATTTSDDTGPFLSSQILAGLLVDGRNVLAVEVHQQSDTSSDVSFDLELQANVVDGEPVQFAVVPAGSTWRYLDDGTNQGTAWRTPNHNDAAWRNAAGRFGYGEGSEVTVLNQNGTSGNRIRTFYFRKEFNLTNIDDIDLATLRLLRDDGAAVYLNGVEIRRDNLGPNAGFNDLATVSVGNADENLYFNSVIDRSLLVNGRNVLAVEVHQQSDTSSDVSFDLELLVEDIPSSVNPLITLGDTWKYLDSGANLGTGWRGATFNDGVWPTGRAEFGFGDGDEATVVARDTGAGTRVRTYYFRREFNVADPQQIEQLLVSLQYDDGVAAYLNGTEVIRENLADGALFDQFALATAPGENDYFDFSINPALLVTGRNVLAVEIHQDSDTSSDISFDLSLEGRSATPEVDLYSFELDAEQVGRTWDVLLQGTDADFSHEQLQLIGPDGTTVLAIATAGAASANYDLAIHDVTLTTAGTYRLRLESLTRGIYGIVIAANNDAGGSLLEVEPNSGAAAVNNRTYVGETVWAFADTGVDDDAFVVRLVKDIPVLIFTGTPFDGLLGRPQNSLDPMVAIGLPGGPALATDLNSRDGKNSSLTFVPSVTGDYEIHVGGTSGSGEYFLSIAMPGDANVDGVVDANDLSAWMSHRFTSGSVTWNDGDFNGDRVVDGSDFNIWNQYKFTSYPAAAAAAVVTRLPASPLAAAHRAAVVSRPLFEEPASASSPFTPRKTMRQESAAMRRAARLDVAFADWS